MGRSDRCSFEWNKSSESWSDFFVCADGFFWFLVLFLCGFCTVCLHVLLFCTKGLKSTKGKLVVWDSRLVISIISLSFNPIGIQTTKFPQSSNLPLSIADENYATLQAELPHPKLFVINGSFPQIQGSLLMVHHRNTRSKDWSAEGTIRRFVD